MTQNACDPSARDTTQAGPRAGQARGKAMRDEELRLLRRIAGEAPLAGVLDDLCLTLESLASRPLRCAVMLADAARDTLRCVAGPSMPQDYLDRAACALHAGDSACARALRSGAPVVIADALADASADDQVLALRRAHGYAAVWTYPIVQDGAALGTLAFLPHASGAPLADDTRLIELGVEVARLALAQERGARALRESERRFHDFADMAADWFWEQDAEFRFTEVAYGRGSRPAAAPFFDLDAIGRRRWELPYVNLPEGFWEAHRRLLEAGQPFANLHLQRQTEGGIRHVEISGRPIVDEAGRLAGYRGVGRDITRQMAAREEQERTWRWLEQALRAAKIGLWERDPDTWDFRLSANWKALFGYAEREIGNGAEDFDRLIHPDDLEATHAIARAYAADPQGEYENRFRVRHRDGSWRWVLSRGSIVASAATGRRSWVGCHLDMTEQRRAEQALRESEALIARVLELLPVGVWVAGADGMILRANEAGRRIWAGERYVDVERHGEGFSGPGGGGNLRTDSPLSRWRERGGVKVDRPLAPHPNPVPACGERGQEVDCHDPQESRLNHGEYRGGWAGSGRRIAAGEWALARAIRGGETSIDEEIEIECFDGTRKVILHSAMPLRDAQGAISGGIAVNQDITARSRAEREVRALNATLEERVRARTADLEEANRELDAFNYSVSHDLRTPLRAIHGFSQALREDHAAQLDAAGREHLARIEAGAARMGELIDAMYQLARMTRALAQIRPVDLSAIACAAIAELRTAEPARNIDAIVAPGLTADGDPRLLGVLLRNLIGNAWKFTARAAAARIEFGREAGGAAFFVRDNGAGFDMRFADRLFRLFQRLHRDEEFRGQGTGLVTAQRIAQRHGGRIWAEAGKGRGAVFRFTLWECPAARHAAEEALQRRED